MITSVTGFIAYLRKELAQTFRSLSNGNFRTYASGQLISLTGTWMQAVALAWYTYNLTQSALMMAVITLCSNLPVLALGLFGGMTADRYNRRRIVIAAVWIEMGLAAVLASLYFTGMLDVRALLTIACLQGIVAAFEMPARQAFVADVVAGEDMVNAISLNSVTFNITRMFGPALGAILLSNFGEGVCFVINAVSFLAAIYTLRKLSSVQKRQTPGDQQKPSIRDGLRVALSNPTTRHLLVLTLFISFFGFQFSFLIPVFVKTVFHGEGHALAILTSASAVGALAGSLFLANRGRPETLQKIISLAACGVAISLGLFAFSTSLILSAFLEVLIGVSIAVQLNGSNSLLQLSVPDNYRGRVMSVYTMILMGAVPFGSLLAGNLADSIGAPLAVAICSGACALSALFYLTRRKTTGS